MAHAVEALAVGIRSTKVCSHAIMHAHLRATRSHEHEREHEKIRMHSAEPQNHSAEHVSSPQGWLIVLHLIVSRTHQ